MLPETDKGVSKQFDPGAEQAARQIPRSHLARRFMDGLAKKLTLIEAPAGYGKTTLMRIWSEQLRDQGHVVLWLQGGIDSAETSVLEEQILSELKRDSNSESGPISPSSGAAMDETSLQHVILEGLSDYKRQVTLFVDDFHDCSAREIRFINRIISNTAKSVHVVIGTREAQGIPLTKLRLDGLVSDFGVEELRLDRSEVAELLGSSAQSEKIDFYLAYSEGWIAAIQLLRQANIVDLSERKGVGGEARVAQYLNEHFFNQLSEAQQAFLIDTAHMRTIDGDLANFVRQKEDAWRLLDELSDVHGLVFEVPNKVPRYRYHQLLRDFLLKRQVLQGEGAVKNLHRRTAEWLFRHGRLLPAIRHAIEAKDADRAVEMLLDSGGVQIGMRHGAPRLAACLDMLPISKVHSNPRLLIARAYLLLKSARMDEARLYLDEIKQSADSADELTWREFVMVEAHRRVYEDRHLSEAQLASLEHAANTTPVEDVIMRGLFSNFLCIFYIQAGDFKKAQEHADAAMSIFIDLDAVHLQFFMHLHLSVIDLDKGRFSSAQSRRRLATKLIESNFQHDPALCALADIYLCEIQHEQSLRSGVEEKLVIALDRAGRAEGWSEAFLSGYETVLGACIEDGRYKAAVSYVARAEEMASRRASDRFERHLRILQLELAVASEDQVEANRLSIQVRSLQSLQGQNMLRWRGQILATLALARFEQWKGKTIQALSLLDDVTKECCKLGLGRYQIRAESLRLVVLATAENWESADRCLRELLSIVDPKFPGPCVRLGDSFPQAVRDCIHSNGLGSYSETETQRLAELLWACSRQKNRNSGSIFEEILTEREYSVLRLVADNAANKVIARELDLSEATVKFHMKNIFAKLGVNSRKLVAEIAHAHGL